MIRRRNRRCNLFCFSQLELGDATQQSIAENIVMNAFHVQEILFVLNEDDKKRFPKFTCQSGRLKQISVLDK